MKGHNYGNIPCVVCGKIHFHPGGSKGRIPWNKGSKGLQIAWNKGLNKETNESIRKYGQACSKTKKGKPSLSKGKKRPSVQGILNPAKRSDVRQKISEALEGQKHPWNSKRNKSEEMRSFNRKRLLYLMAKGEGVFGWLVESKQHKALKILAKEYATVIGFSKIEIERPVRINKKFYIIDVYAKNDNGERLAIECGDCLEEKLFALRSLCSIVIHIPYIRGVIHRREKLLEPELLV